MKSDLQKIRQLMEENKDLLERLVISNHDERQRLERLRHLSTVNLKLRNASHETGSEVNLFDNKYVEIVDGIAGRIFNGTYLNFDEEALFRHPLNEMSPPKEDELILFVKFHEPNYGDGFPTHLHSVEENTYVIYGNVVDEHNKRNYPVGKTTYTAPYQYHSFNPKSEGACIVMVSTGDPTTYLPKEEKENEEIN